MKLRKAIEILLFISAFVFLAMSLIIGSFDTRRKLFSNGTHTISMKDHRLEIYSDRGDRPLSNWHVEMPGIAIDRTMLDVHSTGEGHVEMPGIGEEFTDVTINATVFGVVGTFAMLLRLLMFLLRKMDTKYAFPCGNPTTTHGL